MKFSNITERLLSANMIPWSQFFHTWYLLRGPNRWYSVGVKYSLYRRCEITVYPVFSRARAAQSVYWLATGWDGPRFTSRWGGKIFHAHPDRPWGPPSLLYDGHRVFPGGKSARVWCWPPNPNLAPTVKEYSYTSTSPLGLCGLL